MTQPELDIVTEEIRKAVRCEMEPINVRLFAIERLLDDIEKLLDDVRILVLRNPGLRQHEPGCYEDREFNRRSGPP